MVIEVCRGAGWHVPEQVAVLGVDNNEMNCEASRPTLSSVQPAAEAIGRQAAELLERLLEGHPADSHIEVPPVGVVTRMSTELTAVSDPIVATALSFIKNRAHESISVDDVAEHVGVSKRTLQTRFRVGLDLTVAGERSASVGSTARGTCCVRPIGRSPELRRRRGFRVPRCWPTRSAGRWARPPWPIANAPLTRNRRHRCGSIPPQIERQSSRTAGGTGHGLACRLTSSDETATHPGPYAPRPASARRLP